MGLVEDLRKEVDSIFSSRWTERDGTVVPKPEDIGLGNDAVRLDATVLYADIADSTRLVNSQTSTFAAEIYKAFLLCAGRVIRDKGGSITAYDGDRIMAVFVGARKNTAAAEAALGINYAVTQIINPAMTAVYTNQAYRLEHVVGVDTSKLFVARTGFRGTNDLVWIGRAANYAAKLAARAEQFGTYVTTEVYGMLHESVKTSSDGRPMWTPVKWTEWDSRTIYASDWWRSP